MPAESSSPPAAAAAPWAPWSLALLFAITLLATVLRMLHVASWSWSEAEAATWRAITLPIAGPDGFFASREGGAPLVPLLLRWLLESGLLPSHGEGWPRLPFAAAGIATVPLLAEVGRRQAGAVVGLGGAALLAIHPQHIATSQSMQPAAVLLLAGLLAVGAAAAGARWRALGVAALSIAISPHGWLVLAVVAAAFWSPRAQAKVAAAAAVLAIPCALALGEALALPVVLLAVVGAVAPWAGAAFLRLAAAVPLALAVRFAVAGTGDATSALLALPLLALFAAGGLRQLYQVAQGALPAVGRLAAVAASLPAAVAVTWLAVDTFLYTTVHGGARTPWRASADAVLRAADAGGGCVVGALAGAPSLTCYLRPNHWRQPGRDPHPGLEVRAATPATFAALLDALATSPRAEALLVLREDEPQHGMADELRARLQRDFVLWRVVPSPQAHGSDTLYVWRRSAAH